MEQKIEREATIPELYRQWRAMQDKAQSTEETVRAIAIANKIIAKKARTAEEAYMQILADTCDGDFEMSAQFLATMKRKAAR